MPNVGCVGPNTPVNLNPLDETVLDVCLTPISLQLFLIRVIIASSKRRNEENILFVCFSVLKMKLNQLANATFC